MSVGLTEQSLKSKSNQINDNTLDLENFLLHDYELSCCVLCFQTAQESEGSQWCGLSSVRSDGPYQGETAVPGWQETRPECTDVSLSTSETTNDRHGKVSPTLNCKNCSQIDIRFNFTIHGFLPKILNYMKSKIDNCQVSPISSP